MQKCADLEEPQKEKNQLEKAEYEKQHVGLMSDLEKERLKENQPEKAVLEKLQDVPIKDLKSVFLGVKSQILRGISNEKFS